ncbi:unnamed protein product [Diatraea saccharalis]|uniref:Ig-like domain-containing protein n=1 Tax=Diatraea saccharalis TaxID=40085 RepID=A0A9N9R9Z0_9NEOP|nr:unnamed protein product [Diatraea saccharalis]
MDVAGDNWRLALTDAKVPDSGIYCCHVSTHPPMLKRFKLIVHPPEIRMSKEAFLESGETLSLKCAVVYLHPGSVEPALRWYKGNTTTPLDEQRGGVLIETDHLTLTSHLQVARLKTEDAGNYTCVLEAPLQMKAMARVHVLQGMLFHHLVITLGLALLLVLNHYPTNLNRLLYLLFYYCTKY